MTTESNFLDDIAAALQVLENGGVILYPTDTVWGIGCDATNSDAVAKIFRIKRRAESKSLLALVDSTDQIECRMQALPPAAAELMTSSPRPVTVILSGVNGLAEAMYADDRTVGIRLTHEKYSSELCRRLGRPLVSTSANFSGEPTPAIFTEISRQLIDQVDYTALYRRDDYSRSLPSMLVKINADNSLTILRK